MAREKRKTGMSRSDLTALYALPQTGDATGQGLTMEDHVMAGQSAVLACSYDSICPYSKCSHALTGVMSTTQERRAEIASHTVIQNVCTEWYAIRINDYMYVYLHALRHRPFLVVYCHPHALF